MEKEKLSEHGKFIIERFDHYYDSINNKGNFFLTINTFLIGVIVSGYTFLQEKLKLDNTIQWLIAILALLGLVSIVFTIWAILPYLKSGNRKKYKSLLFFGSISEYSEIEFIKAFNENTDEAIRQDISRQIYTLAKGLNKKFARLKVAGIFLILEFLVITVITILILTR